MSDIKMVDAFIMPVKRVEGGVLPMLYDNQNGLIFVANHEYVDAAAIAINSHDKLTEQNKMLREFVKSMKLDGADEIRRMILLEDIKC